MKIIWSTKINSSQSDKTYFVRLGDDGKWLCNCRAFLFGRRKDGLCRHIDEAIIKKNKGDNDDKND